MGTQDPRSPVDAPDPRSSRGPQRSEADLSAEDVLQQILAALGPGRIAQAAVTSAISLELGNIGDSERIARELGLDHAGDHLRQEPAATVWSGTYLGVEVPVQAALRGTTGSAQ